MTADFADFSPQLKDFYADGRPELVAYDNHPTLRLLRKRYDWTGALHEVPVWYEAAQAVGHDFSTVIGDKAAGKHIRFAVSTVDYYGVASIDRLTMKRSAGANARAFLSAATSEIDGVLSVLGNRISHELFRDPAAVLGRISAVASVNGTNDQLTLTNREDVTQFAVGMRLVASDGSAAAGATVDTTVLEVASIDRDAGTMLLVDEGTSTSANITTDWGADAATNNDYLHRAGDVTSTSNSLGMSGFEAWCPATAPTSGDSFFGVDRSVDATRLAGNRIDVSAFEIGDALLEAQRRQYEDGNKISHFALNPSQFLRLVRELENKVMFDESLSKRIGTEAIIVGSGARVYQDPSCPVNVGWGFDNSKHYMCSVGKLPEIFDEDFKMLRESNADAYEVRMGGYGNYCNKQPGTLIRLAFA